ncbi:sarcoplasmic reticulum histidine-rich calcium-binding protein [Oryza brachyantha]|nr:sarcoplasmic reticulum histidine-rich calcium-binding protein [Oryza brachyantha]
MELALEAAGGGSRAASVSLSADSPEAVLGRGDLGGEADRQVSRRHVSLRLLLGGGGGVAEEEEEGEPRVAFEVVGRNPVVVRSRGGGSRVYRRGEAGELLDGDGVALSLRAPSFWAVRRRRRRGSKGGDVEAEVLDAVERRTRERKERERRAAEEAMEVTADEEAAAADADAAIGGELDAEAEDSKFDPAGIDPIREFGFLSMGHEFDNYPKGRIRPPKDWNWFLEELRKSSDDEDDEGGKSKGRVAKKKNEGQREDDDWTGESENEKASLSRGPSVKRSKYVTRSKEPKKPRNEKSEIKGKNKNVGDEVDEEDEEDDEDETLGGFIVNEEDGPMEEVSEEEGDEFDDDDDDDDDD